MDTLAGVYLERSSPRAGGVLWTRTVPRDESELRILPDGCMDLIWTDGALMVAGPDTGPHLTTPRPGTSYVGARFAPGTGPAVLGVPADAVRDQRVPLDALWPDRTVRRLAEQIATSPDPVRALEHETAGRLAQSGPPDPQLVAIMTTLQGTGSVAVTAAAVGLSERQLHRRCVTAFGYGPKTVVRVLRLQGVLAQTEVGAPWATVAAVTGYADQAHMARDVKALTGVTPVALARRLR